MSEKLPLNNAFFVIVIYRSNAAPENANSSGITVGRSPRNAILSLSMAEMSIDAHVFHHLKKEPGRLDPFLKIFLPRLIFMNLAEGVVSNSR
jgi:hypothetical protein